MHSPQPFDNIHIEGNYAPPQGSAETRRGLFNTKVQTMTSPLVENGDAEAGRR